MEQECGFIRALHSFFWLLCWSFQLQSGLDRNLAHPLHANSNASCVFLVRSILWLFDENKFEVPLFALRQKKGYSVATYDLEHHTTMDFLTPAGYLFLGFRLKTMTPQNTSMITFPKVILACRGPRLSIFSVLQMVPDGIFLAGPDCRSWGMPCRHTSGRSILNILGWQELGFVRQANIMVGRFLGCVKQSWNLSGCFHLGWLVHQKSHPQITKIQLIWNMKELGFRGGFFGDQPKSKISNILPVSFAAVVVKIVDHPIILD